MKTILAWASLLLVGVGAPPRLWAQQAPPGGNLPRPFVATVESRTSRWAELFRMEDTARLTPLDRRHFVPVEEARSTTTWYDGSRWTEVVDRLSSSHPDEGMPHPLQIVRHAGGLDFYYADPSQNHALPWSSMDQQAWQERVADGLAHSGAGVLPHPPFPSAQQIKDWGKAVVLNTPQILQVRWGNLSVVYEPGKLLRTERWGTGDSVRRTGYRALPDGGYALAWMEESGRETGQNGVCWTGFRLVEWAEPVVDTGNATVSQWLADRGWTGGVTGPYSRQKTVETGTTSFGDLGDEPHAARATSPLPLACRPVSEGGWRISGGPFVLHEVCGIQVLDATGRILWQADVPWTNDLQLPGGWPAGLYTVWIRQNSRHAHVRLSQPGATFSR